MAHYAFLDPQTHVVLEVIVGHDEGHKGVDWEAYYASVRSLPCRRTSYNTLNGVHRHGGTPYRGTYAGIGYTFDASRGPDGEFVAPE